MTSALVSAAGGERRGAECRAVSEAEGLKSSGNYGVDSFQLEHAKEGGGSDVTGRGGGWEGVKHFVMVSGAGCEVTAVTLHDAAGRFRLCHRKFPATPRVEFEPTSFMTKNHFDHK